ncbi:DUF4280 domain-containing protein [Aquimarina algicola]|uniref:DUF4280 domain-containing protein n=1 Tax=Aquimarina algicola TaxID=2589995 RepID=A0A504JHW6_9FLAO|nr:DUF4280 domain-containing protein [Aquimarina algicola]TPN87428.1 DUF4280 domain-containing protein [Aquimarina algicola]
MSDVAIVCQGAMCKCKFGTVPDKLKIVSTHKEYVNETKGSKKMIATTMDIGQPFEAKTFGQCKLQPSTSGYLPCVPSITQWQDFYDKITVSNQGKILTEKSKAICAIAGAPYVEITFHGQTASPTQSQAEEADEEIHSQLNPLARPKGAPEKPANHVLKIKS